MKNIPINKLLNSKKQNEKSFHNLCTDLKPPSNIGNLLGLGLKFCIEKPLAKPTLSTYMERFTYDIRTQVAMAASVQIEGVDIDLHVDGDTDYDPKLYIPSPNYTPPLATKQIEAALTQFETQLHQLITANAHKSRRKHNINPSTRRLLKQLPNNKDFTVIPTDKNLGPAIMETSTYQHRCLKDHLLKQETYQRLTPEQAQLRLQQSETAMKELLSDFSADLTQAEKTYFDRVFKIKRRTPIFYAAPKVHKPKPSTRPIVSCVNSTLGYLSKYVDTKLQGLLPLCHGYLQDSKSLLKKIKKLGKLPSTAVIVIADAVSMYTNIDTAHALQSLRDWLSRNKHKLPSGFPTELVLAATKLIMENNVFQFGDRFWIQLICAAMGTPMACTYATIYYAIKEEELLRKYHKEFNMIDQPSHYRIGNIWRPTKPNPAPLLLYSRLIDDSFQIWDTALLPPDMPLYKLVDSLTTMMAFGKLEWTVEQPTREASFLDLTLTINPDGAITTRTFVKPMNLHLYIPPQSAHSKGVLKSLIFGNVFRYWSQNSNHRDFIATTKDFFGHLLNRDWPAEVLAPIFRDAADTISQRARKITAVGDSPNRPPPQQEKQLFLHWEYHPRDITRSDIRSVYMNTLEPLLSAPPLGIKRLTIAYSNPPNLRRCLTKTQRTDPPGKQVSDAVEKVELL